MKREIALFRVWAAALVAAAALMAAAMLAGCGIAASQAAAAASEDVLRTRSDPARGRIWVLGVEDLRVYDAATRKLVRRIALPGWSVARYECQPDLVLDASGSATVSSNVVPFLWRVDARSF